MAGLISKDEIIKLSEMKQDEVNISAAQMLVLANSIVSGKYDSNTMIAVLEKQAWYKRMWNKLNGKMKGTSEEFEQHKGLIALYAVQAVSVLFKSDKFDMDMNMAIRQKIIDIYYFTTLSDAEKLISLEILSELRSGLRELAEKLIENTEQTDVVSIITKGMIRNEFNFNNPVVSACVVLSKLDSSILNSEQALDIIRNSISENELFETAEKSISDYMSDVINIPVEKTGVVYLELASMIDNPWATMFSDLIESYNMFPKMERMAKKKDVIIKNIIEKNDLDSDIAFAASDLFEAMLNTRIEIAAMTGKVNIYEDTSDNITKLKEEPETTSSISSRTIEDSPQKEKKYDIYNEPQYDEKDMKFCPHIKLKKDGQYVKCYIPLHDFAVESGKIKKTIYSSKGRSLLKIIYDNMGYISDDEIIISKSGMSVTGINSKISRSGFLLYDIGDNLDYYDISPWRFSYFRVELAIPKAIYDRIIVPKSEVKVCFPDSETVIRRRLEYFMPLTANSMDDKMKLNGLSANELYDNRKLIKASTHLLSFADIEELVHHRGVLIGGMINSSANPAVDTEIYSAYPRMVTPDGNVIMCNTNVDPFIIKG